MRTRRPTSPTDTTEPLIGVDNLTQPVWVAAHDRVAKANLRDAMRSLLKPAKLIARLGWRSAPGTTVAAVALNLAAGCVTACGLLATVNVFIWKLEACEKLGGCDDLGVDVGVQEIVVAGDDAGFGVLGEGD